ncbi:hypothetical protein KFL_006220050 [Klebsormidium nitens]|uniref:PH domain-containing protein n=1 Tax=Klebsormidium nitens TaxID=105231 RepID=A0A1Y1IND6_KLENI|nr:hypothetical protein KFL_006220050 [Klebsormidium nitens]|eukprot:GAQ90286.1 hypothetical protein KFL_006220050 [Klebsormidium nitens]
MKEGYLLKRSDTLKRWRKRWFRLDNKNGRLLYKESKDDKVLKGYFPLVDVSVGPLQSPSRHVDYFCFYVRSSSVSLVLAAESVDVANRWMECIAVAAASASLKASAWRNSSVPETSPVLQRGASRAPDLGRGQSAQLTQSPVPQSPLGTRASTRSECVLATNPRATPLSSQQKPQEDAGMAQQLSQPAHVLQRNDSSGDSSTVVEASPQVVPTSLRELDMDIASWLPGSVPDDSSLETPFETPLSSGETSPATPPPLLPTSGSLEQATGASVNCEGHQQTSAEERTEPREVLREVRVVIHPDPPEASPLNRRTSFQSGETTDPGPVDHSLFQSLDAACPGIALARETSGESDVGTADEDSFQFHAPHASSSSSTDYGRHIGPPFGWANATPRFASQRSTPRARPQSFFPSPRKPGPKQGQLGRGAGPAVSGRSGLGSGPPSSSADLHKLSKSQLISMLQMARDAAAAKEEQLALMQSVAQIDARELAKAMKQAEESAAQAQAALARHQEQARKEAGEQLAKAAVASEIEVRQVKEELAGLKRELDGERANRERLQNEVRELEAELLKHARSAALSAAQCKELKKHEARCKDLEARLASLSTQVHGTETALLKPFW